MGKNITSKIEARIRAAEREIIENETVVKIVEFLARVAEEKDDPVLAAAAGWVARGDWKEGQPTPVEPVPDALVPPGYP